MNVENPEVRSPDRQPEIPDLAIMLRRVLVEEFKSRLIESKSISREQRERLCELLTKPSVSAQDILKVLVVDRDSKSRV